MQVNEDGVPVQEVVEAVKLAIKEANVSEADEDRDLRVHSVRLILHALATRTIGGGLAFTVPFIGMPVRFGVKVTKSDTHDIEISLGAPTQKTGEEVRDGALDLALVDSIETIRAVVASAANGDDPFVLNDAKITLSFAVTAEGDISIGADGSMSDEVTHSLILTLVSVGSRGNFGQWS
jgi:Trypsin-co-occurring domain 2